MGRMPITPGMACAAGDAAEFEIAAAAPYSLLKCLKSAKPGTPFSPRIRIGRRIARIFSGYVALTPTCNSLQFVADG